MEGGGVSYLNVRELLFVWYAMSVQVRVHGYFLLWACTSMPGDANVIPGAAGVTWTDTPSQASCTYLGSYVLRAPMS